MGLLTLFRRTRGRTEIPRAQQVVDDAMRRFGMKGRRSESGFWTATATPMNGYAVKLDIGVYAEIALAMTTADLIFDRDLVQRDLALILLEMNDRYLYGSFRLVSIADCRALALGHSFDTRFVDQKQLAAACGALVRQMESALQRFVGMELIAPGPAWRGQHEGGR